MQLFRRKVRVGVRGVGSRELMWKGLSPQVLCLIRFRGAVARPLWIWGRPREFADAGGRKGTQGVMEAFGGEYWTGFYVEWKTCESSEGQGWCLTLLECLEDLWRKYICIIIFQVPFHLPAASLFQVTHTLIQTPKWPVCWWGVYANSLAAFESRRLLSSLARALRRMSARQQVDFGYLLKMNRSSAAAGLESVKSLGSWVQPFWMDAATLTGQPAQMLFYFLGLRVSSCSSPPLLPVYTCPSSVALLSHSAAFTLCFLTGVLTAAICEIPASALCNDFWLVCCSPHLLPIRRTQILESLIGWCTAPKISCLVALIYWIS